MAEIRRLTEEQAMAVRNMVRENCANYVDGNCLLLSDDDFCPCPQLITYSLLCRYFIKAVLPGNRQLNGDIMNWSDTRKCCECGQFFYPKGPRTKYCDKCRPIVRRRQIRERVRRKRASM